MNVIETQKWNEEEAAATEAIKMNDEWATI